MHNYSSAKLELLALKWAVTEKFRNYLLGSKFTVYTNNNPVAYVQTSKLGASQICWLSDLALFNYNIICRSCRTNKSSYALSWYPEPSCELGSDSDTDSDEPVVLLYATICNIIKPVLGDTKCPFAIKKEAQATSNSVEGKNNGPEFCAVPNHTVKISAVSVFDQVPPASMAKAQTKDSVLGLVNPFICKGVNPKGFVISKIRYKSVCK